MKPIDIQGIIDENLKANYEWRKGCQGPSE